MNGKTAGNLILMTTICIVIFWIFMALRPANADTGPFWVSALKISCGQKSGIWWLGMNGAGHFIRFYPSREETTDYEMKDKVLIVQGKPCKTEPFDCALLGVSAPGAEPCGLALPQK